MADNLERQGGTYHVRLAIPKDVQPAFGNSRVLSKSLGTADRNEAMRLRLQWLVKWKSDIHQARNEFTPTESECESALSKTLDLASLFDQVKSRGALAALRVQPVRYADLEGASMLPPDILNELDVLTAAGDHQAIIHLVDTLKANLSSFIQAAGTRSGIAMQEAGSILAGTYKPKSPITTTRLREFRVHRTAHNLGAKPIDTQEAKLTKLSAYLSETGKPLDFDSVAAFLNTLEGLTSKTKRQYLLAGNVFWKWAVKYDTQWREHYKGLASPFENHDLPQLRGREAKEAKRKPFEIEDLPKLHAAALAKKDTILAATIQLGAYSGARIEELCQLKTENIILVDGVSCFDIVDSKTVAGIRQVPIHPALAAMVQQLVKDSEDGWLLPIKTKNMYGIRSDALSKRFGRLKTELKFGPLHVFHSIRHTVTTCLHQAGLPLTTVQQLIGHETKTVTLDVYSQGLSATQKLEAISKIAYPELQPQ